METFIEFFSFSDPNVRWVTIGTILIGAGAALVGCFTFLKKKSLVGDAVAHSILPGVCLSFILSGTKNPVYLLVGATITGFLSIVIMDIISNRSKLKPDTSIAIVLSVFFAIGMMLLSSIQGGDSGNQSGLNHFLFGKAASMVRYDVIVFSIVDIVLIISIFLGYRLLKIFSFDPQFAQAIGLPVKAINVLLSILTVLAVATGIQSVGVVLMAALLITPAASARFWTNKLFNMLLIAILFGMLAGLFGSFISYSAPSMPTGPWIVMLLSIIAVISVYFSPDGLFFRRRQQIRHKRKIVKENILKTIYQLREINKTQEIFSISQLREKRAFANKEFVYSIKVLEKEDYIMKNGESLMLSKKGLRESARVVRLHRLWELYLSTRMRMKSDHVHDTAEAMEHIISPEMEKELLQELDYPVTDPHQSLIPGIHKPD